MSHELGSKFKFAFQGVRGYGTVMKLADKQKLINNHPEIEKKLKVIGFFEKYDIKTTVDAFEKSRSIIYLWKKKYQDKGIYGLVNKSTKPYNTRKMYVDTKIFDFIKALRERYPRLGKDKIKILLDDYCQKENIKSVSESKVGRIIKRNNWYFYLGKRNKGRIRRDKKRAFGYEVKKPGDLFQIDTVVRFEHGIKRYIVTAIDVVSKFAFAYTYKNHSSRSTADFAQKLIGVTPYPIKAIQTDNGSEFLKDFDKSIATNSIVHFFIYPRCPKQNGCIERFNRTIQEDFVEENRVLLEEKDLKQFNHLLIDYLLFYNTIRPHHSLKNKVPMKTVTDFLKQSNMYRTDTFC
ncbi:DDE-type integrase/transposase/recombinase [Patescibacteria group bacterium]|nr:DDE-type integrase/transposase/recombinase [Patescibacteria group bacterium]